MRVTKAEIEKAAEQITNSMMVMNRSYVLRPSGLLRKSEEKSSLEPDEIKAMHAMQAMASIKSMLHYGNIRDKRCIAATMFVAGFVYEVEQDTDRLKKMMNECMKADFLTEGYGDEIDADAVEEFVRHMTDDLAVRSLIAIMEEKHQIRMIGGSSWMFGRKIRRFVEDTKQLDELFAAEGLKWTEGLSEQ